MPTPTPAPTLTNLPDHALTGRLLAIRHQERTLLVEFLALLVELHRRRTVLALGHSSLFSYLTDRLGYTKGAAFRRTTAARLFARFPIVADYLSDGRLNLTTLVELRDVLDEAHAIEILDRAANRTEDQVKALVATLRPQPAPADLLRRLPTPRNDNTGSGPALPTAAGTPAAPTTPPLPGASLPLPSPSPTPLLATTTPPPAALAPPLPTPTPPPSTPIARPATTPPARLQPIAPELHVLRFTVGSAFVADLQSVRHALSHKLPGARIEEVLHECVRATLAHIERRRRGAGKKTSSKPPSPDTRYVPAAIRYEVWKRDGGQCAFIGTDGHRCTSRHQLELHHLQPFAMGGPATVDNLALRCRVHNRYAAEQDYGMEHIARTITARQVRRQ